MESQSQSESLLDYLLENLTVTNDDSYNSAIDSISNVNFEQVSSQLTDFSDVACNNACDNDRYVLVYWRKFILYVKSLFCYF